MNNTHTGITTPVLVIVVALAMIMAGGYGYSKVYRKEKDANDLLDSARRSLERSSRPVSEIAAELNLAKGKLQNEINRLEIFRQSGFNTSSSYGLALLTIEKELSDSVIGRTNDIYKLVNESNIDASLKLELTQDRQKLIALINAWKKALATTGATQATVGAAADAAIAAAQQYVAMLDQATQSLTPQNSNLTETQIATQQQVVDQAINTANQANNNINTVQPNTDTIVVLQETVQNLQQELQIVTENNNNNLNQNNNIPPNNQTPIENVVTPPPYVPPLPRDTTGEPQLIEGSNSF